jgi:hypothetical protein
MRAKSVQGWLSRQPCGILFNHLEHGLWVRPWAVMVWLGKGEACRKVGVTANSPVSNFAYQPLNRSRALFGAAGTCRAPACLGGSARLRPPGWPGAVGRKSPKGEGCPRSLLRPSRTLATTRRTGRLSLWVNASASDGRRRGPGAAGIGVKHRLRLGAAAPREKGLTPATLRGAAIGL